jgi:hypothetical protein
VSKEKPHHQATLFTGVPRQPNNDEDEKITLRAAGVIIN